MRALWKAITDDPNELIILLEYYRNFFFFSCVQSPVKYLRWELLAKMINRRKT